jgi:cell division protein FtsZ
LSVAEASDDIRSVLENTDILFLIAGLGKGTGSGASPEIAKIARQLGILTVAIVNFPSVNAEGRSVFENALGSFNALKDEVDAITKISNDKIISNDKNISFVQAFEQANIEVTNVVNDIVDMVSSASNMNLDFADIKNFFNSQKTFIAGTFALTNEYSYEALKTSITQSIQTSYSDMLLEKNNTKLILNLKISTKVPSSVTHDIRKIFKELTHDHALTLVNGIDYVNIEGLKASYLISANDQEQSSVIETDDVNTQVHNNSDVLATESFMDINEYKDDTRISTGGVKHETIKFDTQDIILESERFNSHDIGKLMTKAINHVMNNDSDLPHFTKKCN